MRPSFLSSPQELRRARQEIRTRRDLTVIRRGAWRRSLRPTGCPMHRNLQNLQGSAQTAFVPAPAG
jgi:hypothetical protein